MAKVTVFYHRNEKETDAHSKQSALLRYLCLTIEADQSMEEEDASSLHSFRLAVLVHVYSCITQELSSVTTARRPEVPGN